MRPDLMIVSSLALACAMAPASAQTLRPSLMDSFRLGSGGGVLCQVQNRGTDPVANGMFDRAWSIVCRDAAKPVGQLYALRNIDADASARLVTARGEEIRCGAETPASITGLGAVQQSECAYTSANVGYRVYRYRTGKVTYVAQGLAGYDSALQLGLRTIVADRPVDGEINVATTGVTDPAAFARVQAGSLDPAQTLAEGYRRNNSGDYAEAAAFFDTLQQRIDENEVPGTTDIAIRNQRLNEYVINRALQKSNLGQFAEADALFRQAAAIPTLDRVQVRLRRNFEALHLLNQQQYQAALDVLARPVVTLGEGIGVENGAVTLGAGISSEMNSSATIGQRLGLTQSVSLSPDERAAILDAQAQHLRGTIARLQGQPAAARSQLQSALASAVAIRDGRVTSITRLRAQIMAEIGLAYEDEGDFGAAEGQLRGSLDLLRTSYPETNAMNGARARLAAYLVRRGQRDAALGLYREVVQSAAANHGATTGLSNQLAPYFALLAEQIPARPELADDLFLATQTLLRPGVADTQAILSRELSQGDGEASRLFRQAVTLSRDIERGRIELARLEMVPDQDAVAVALIATQRASLDALVSEQAITQAKLNGYAQYRAVASEAMTLGDLRAALKPGEAYYKLSVVGHAVYALYADAAGATGWRLPIGAEAMAAKVTALRDTLSHQEGGQLVTYPFDVALARTLYLDLFAPVAGRIDGIDHLIFEPDGAMLALPPNLLIAGQPGVDAYLKRVADPEADQFDFTGIEWLGRRHAISTAVSASSFRDARKAPASRATRQYIGFGQNAPVSEAARSSSSNRSMSGEGAVDCSWPLAEWNKPISAVELRETAARIGTAPAAIVTGNAFSDTAIRDRTDLSDYRILHFATHGLVTAPRPECPARPALLTSFGDRDSDGLLTFGEIYDLKIDADLVILSACDTAGQASAAATREAGVTTGGGSALDGLVRAFIGAGGRSVVASHWPAPDDFNATQRLIAGLFEGKSGTDIAQGLRQSEVRLMDEAATSHPYYWSGFAIVGDGAQQLLVAGR